MSFTADQEDESVPARPARSVLCVGRAGQSDCRDCVRLGLELSRRRRHVVVFPGPEARRGLL